MLAAGVSRRFGGPKLRAPLAGRPLAEWSLGAVARARAEGTVGGAVLVHSPDDAWLAALGDDHGFLRAHSTDAHLIGSLGAGLAGLAHTGADAAMVVLADQPLLDPGVMSRLEHDARARGWSAARPSYAEAPEVPGHPVWLRADTWPMVAGAGEGEPLAALFHRHGVTVREIPVPGANPDVDTPEDLERVAALASAVTPGDRRSRRIPAPGPGGTHA